MKLTTLTQATLCLFALMPFSAVAQGILPEKEIIDCGRTGYQKPVTATFELVNKSNKRLSISQVKADCGCTQAKIAKDKLDAGEKTTIELTYDGQMLGHYVKQAAVYIGDEEKPFYLTMKGIVAPQVEDYSGNYPYKVGTLLTDMEVIEFDNVNMGDEPQQIIHIMNSGTSEITPNLQHLPPYLTAISSPEKLRPGQRGQITLTLNSKLVRGYGLTQTSVHLASKLGEKISNENEMPVSVVTLPDLKTYDGKNKQYAPKMELSADTVLLGRINGKEKKAETITLANKGRMPLTISSIQMFTPGLTITLGKRELQPGEQTKMKITANRRKLLKQKTKPRILMITNDPDKTKFIINIKIK